MISRLAGCAMVAVDRIQHAAGTCRCINMRLNQFSASSGECGFGPFVALLTFRKARGFAAL
jgi:hypothetical protein